MNETVQSSGKGHSLMANERREITVSGVTDVVSFDETNVRLITSCGILNLEGEGLRIHVLNTKDGTVAVTGQLNGVLYEDVDTTADPRQASGRGRRRLFGL